MPEETDRFRTDLAAVDDPLGHGVDLFNKGYFFEAHDVWEEIWTVDRTTARKFYQGLIKIAGGFHHYGNGNYVGSVALLTAGLGHLEPYGERHGGVDLKALREAVGRELEKITRLRDGASGRENVVPPKIAYG